MSHPVVVVVAGQAPRAIAVSPQQPTVAVVQSGPRGPAGAASLQRVAAQALGGHRIVRALANGKVDYASSDTPDHAELIIGVTAGATVNGAMAEVRTAGELIEGSWSWTPGPLFCGLNGVLTQSPPASGFIRQVAVAETATRIVIDLRPPIVL